MTQKWLASVLLALVSLLTNSIAQKTMKAPSTLPFSTSRCFSKGGLGIINPNLFVLVKTNENELYYGSGGRAPNDWKGKTASESELVVFYDNRVWSVPQLPDRFDLSQAVVISFEHDKVRFFSFPSMDGCYYQRFTN